MSQKATTYGFGHNFVNVFHRSLAHAAVNYRYTYFDYTLELISNFSAHAGFYRYVSFFKLFLWQNANGALKA